MSKTTLFFRTYGTLVARVLIGGFFLNAGLTKLFGPGGVAATVDYIDSVGLPAPVLLAWLAIIIEVVLGLAVILGKKTSRAALGLTIFVVLVTFFFHGPQFWAEQSMQQALFMKNIAILAGLFYIIAYGPGDGWHLGASKRSPSAQSGSPSEDQTPS